VTARSREWGVAGPSKTPLMKSPVYHRFQKEAAMFEPENSLEALMQAAGKDPQVVPAFYRALLETEIYVLTPEAPMKPGRRRSLKFQETINIATVEFQGLKWHPAFTSKKRISDYLKEPETCLGAAAHNLFEMLPDSNFWLNPLSECQKPLPASEIALLMNGKIFEMLKTTS
jgi:type III secretion system (T3SS) SseB-like protein